MPQVLSAQVAPDLDTLVQSIAQQVPDLVQKVIPGRVHGASVRVQGIGSLAHAGPTELSFIVSARYAQELESTKACAVVMELELFEQQQQSGAVLDYACIVSPQPYLFYALAASWFEKVAQPVVKPGIDPRASVSAQAVIDPTAVIGPNVIVGDQTRIGAGVQIHANTVIGRHCEIGANSVLYPNVTLYDRVRVGERAVIHSGVVLGADGFGFAPNPMAGPGAWGKIAQLGGVRIGDDVEIGANTTIDRGALEDTTIGNGVKIDNQIMIGHNCQIGDHTAMAACVGIAGSTTIGARCIIGGAAMFAGHLTVTDDVQISGGTAVTSDIRKSGRYTGVFPLAEHTAWQKNAAVLGQLSVLRRRLRELERQKD